jgi:3',5'-cyclic AMP phosphodiesterase CpdA
METAMNKQKSPQSGEVDRRGVLRCGAWAGAGVLWTMRGGVAASTLLGADASASATRDLTFVQISDSHIGFHRPENPDVAATLQQTIAKIRALPRQPDFILHTGDITHLSTPEQFDNAQQILRDLNLPIHFVPGEHDTQDPGNGREFLNRFGAGTRGDGWYSFDHSGVHFIGLVNVVHLNPGGLGGLGADQIAWLGDDVVHLRASTPIVVFAHMPMWSLYPQWGWGTQDADAALAPLRRFGSVTVLNGHVHQIQQHVEGNIAFHTAHPTAYPQPAPGAAPAPGPMLVPAAALGSYLGLRSIEAHRARAPLTITETTLA